MFDSCCTWKLYPNFIYMYCISIFSMMSLVSFKKIKKLKFTKLLGLAVSLSLLKEIFYQIAMLFSECLLQI